MSDFSGGTLLITGGTGSFTFGLKSGTDFAAGISGVILVEQRLFGKGKDKQAEIQYSCGFVAGWLPKS